MSERFFKFTCDKEVIEEIKISLGEPTVKVELDDSAWNAVLRNAKRWFMAKKSLISVVKKNYSSAKGCIPFSEIDTVNGCYRVLDVLPDGNKHGFPGSGLDCTVTEILPNGFPLWGGSDQFTFSYNQRGSSYILQIYQNIEQRQQIWGSQFGWVVQFDHFNGHAVYINPNQEDVQVLIIYKPSKLPVDLLEGRDSQLFYDWAEADAKEKLGRIRSKYSEYPSVDGTISMDGDTLLEEAKETKERLEEEISGSQGPMPILVG